MTAIALRCTECYSSGEQRVFDDESGDYRRERCEACEGTGKRFVAPSKRNQLRRHGVVEAVVSVDVAVREEFSHPTIALKGKGSVDDMATLWELSFQRHRLEQRDAWCQSLPDARLDVGPCAWSHCYGGRIVHEARRDGGFSLEHPSDLLRAASLLKVLQQATGSLANRTCELGVTIDALRLLGCPVRIRYWYRGAWLETMPADAETGKGAERVRANEARANEERAA